MERFCKKVNVIGMLELLIWLDKKACVGDATNVMTVIKCPAKFRELSNHVLRLIWVTRPLDLRSIS